MAWERNFKKMPSGGTRPLGFLISALWIYQVLITNTAFAKPASDDLVIENISQRECKEFEKILIDPTFRTVGEGMSAWTYRQHMSNRSFEVKVEDGQLNFRRIGEEPWAVMIQQIKDARLSGRALRFSAELKGNISEEVTHGFGARAGLFLMPGSRRLAVIADHDPHIGTWDWQRVSIEVLVPEIFDSVEVGFIHQGGEGSLSVRAPRIQLAECE